MQTFKEFDINKVVITFSEVDLDSITMCLKTEEKVTPNLLICLIVKIYRSMPYKSISKQFNNINFENISTDLCELNTD